jgi:hypothetical protein
MSKPGFYNDNQYRDYPFIAQPAEPITLPPSAIVDAGFIMGYDAAYDDATDTVFLKEVRLTGNTLAFDFSFTSNDAATVLTFSALTTGSEYRTIFQESAPAASPACGDDPIWQGFIVIGPVTDLLAALENANGVLRFSASRYAIEPARIQNLNKAYLRGINVGNVGRIAVPECGGDETETPADTQIIAATCLQGAIKFEEGYQTSITQVNRDNAILFKAQKTSGDPDTTDLCTYQGELPLYPTEPDNLPFIHGQVGDTPPRRSTFLSGGWACGDLMFTINGIGGSNVNIVGGKNIQVGVTDDGQAIRLSLAENARGRCNG